MTATRSFAHELEARPEQREAARQTSPGPLRAATGIWCWLRRVAHAVGSRCGGARRRWQRGRRGWADRDLRDLDTYLCGVIAGSVTRLRDTGQGHSTDLSQDDWHDTLTRIAGPLRTWSRGPRTVDGESTQARREREDREYAEAQDALRLMADRLRDLWD